MFSFLLAFQRAIWLIFYCDYVTFIKLKCKTVCCNSKIITEDSKINGVNSEIEVVNSKIDGVNTEIESINDE